eukprot:4773560-Prymnesium_polylepis.1
MGASSRTPSPHRVVTLPLSRLVTRDRHFHAPPSRNSVSEGDLTASQSAPQRSRRRAADVSPAS